MSAEIRGTNRFFMMISWQQFTSLFVFSHGRIRQARIARIDSVRQSTNSNHSWFISSISSPTFRMTRKIRAFPKPHSSCSNINVSQKRHTMLFRIASCRPCSIYCSIRLASPDRVTLFLSAPFFVCGSYHPTRISPLHAFFGILFLKA